MFIKFQYIDGEFLEYDKWTRMKIKSEEDTNYISAKKIYNGIMGDIILFQLEILDLYDEHIYFLRYIKTRDNLYDLDNCVAFEPKDYELSKNRYEKHFIKLLNFFKNREMDMEKLARIIKTFNVSSFKSDISNMI